MAQEYASQQPQGFKNHIETIAVVGVSQSFPIPQAQFLIMHDKTMKTHSLNRPAVESASSS